MKQTRKQRKAENHKAVEQYLNDKRPFYVERYEKGRAVKIRRDGCFDFAVGGE